jgi:hypothetical protein
MRCGKDELILLRRLEQGRSITIRKHCIEITGVVPDGVARQADYSLAALTRAKNLVRKNYAVEVGGKLAITEAGREWVKRKAVTV